VKRQAGVRAPERPPPSWRLQEATTAGRIERGSAIRAGTGSWHRLSSSEFDASAVEPARVGRLRGERIANESGDVLEAGRHCRKDLEPDFVARFETSKTPPTN